MEIALIVSAVLQWSVLIIVVAFILSTLRLVGTIVNAHNLGGAIDEGEQAVPPEPLKGVNVANELVYEERAKRHLSILELGQGEPLALVLLDPTCTKCAEAVAGFLEQRDVPLQSIALIVRAPANLLVHLSDDYPEELRIAAEHSGLRISGYAPPYVFVLDRFGGYVASYDLSTMTNLRLPFEVIDKEWARTAGRTESDIVQIMPL